MQVGRVGDMLFWLCLLAIGLALWNRVRIDDLARSISELHMELTILRRTTIGADVAITTAPAAAPAPAPEPTFFDAVVADEPVPPPPSPEPAIIEDAKPDIPPPQEAFASPQDQATEPAPRPYQQPQPIPPAEDTGTVVDLERQFGARLPVWIGGIALALAGFFLVRYTIEIGLLTETVRVVLGGIF